MRFHFGLELKGNNNFCTSTSQSQKEKKVMYITFLNFRSFLDCKRYIFISHELLKFLEGEGACLRFKPSSLKLEVMRCPLMCFEILKCYCTAYMYIYCIVCTAFRVSTKIKPSTLEADIFFFLTETV